MFNASPKRSPDARIYFEPAADDRRAPLAAAAFIGVLAGGVIAAMTILPTFAAKRANLADAATVALAPTAIAQSHEPADTLAPISREDQVDDAPAYDVALGDLPKLKPERHAPADVALAAADVADIAPRVPNHAAPIHATPVVDAAVDVAATPLAVALARYVDAPGETTTLALARGETLAGALARAGVDGGDLHAAVSALAGTADLRRLRAGQEFTLTAAAPFQTLFQEASAPAPASARLIKLGYRPDPANEIFVQRSNDAYAAEKRALALTTERVALRGRIDGSLYAAAKAAGAPDRSIVDIADMFAYDVDFQRDVRRGDEFEAVVELKYDEDGRLADVGDVLFARLKWRGGQKEKGYYRFAGDNSGRKPDYFDADGRSAKRLLMKTPISGARLSSGFGTRKHPILGYRKAHRGVDFAARSGTPIYAAGDGVVERANRYGSFGNYVRIRHANGYKTAYAHLKGFKRGIRAGARVEQGDVIGYVGTTGRSTGPHLHYEVHLNGQRVNPQRLKIATGRSLTGDELADFKAARDLIDVARAGDAPSPVLAEEAAEPRNAPEAL
ncbi:MAG: peptidoglycan DD-metalloendopeptidase family protein [Parvularculaceae bacterium]